MTRTLTPPAPVSLAEFDRLYESVKNWGRWGPDDDRGTLNYITPDKVAAAAALVRSGRSVSMAIPINKAAGPDNPNPAVHLMSLMHDIPISKSGLTFGMCFLGMASHGDCHTHVDALNHVGYKGLLYNGKPAATLTSRGSEWGSIAAYATGIVGPRRAARRGPLSQGRLARAGRGGEPRRAGGDREGGGRQARRGRHPRLPHRPSCPPPGARRLEQRLPAGRPGQGRAARRHRAVDARAEGSRRSFPTATARRCRATSRTCPIRSIRCS